MKARVVIWTTALVLGLTGAALGLKCLARSRTLQLFGRLVPRVETKERVVALTFDDGPTAERASEILELLRAGGVKATFFVNGFHLAQDLAPAQKLVAEGHQLGNHTFSHDRMVLKSQATYRDEVERTDSLIRAAGYVGQIFFRPPFTWKLLGLPWFLSRTGRTTITCDVEPESYSHIATSTERIVAHVLDQVRPGSIVLLHVWYPANGPSRAAIPGIVGGLKTRGFRFLTVSELLGAGGEGAR